MAQLQNVYQITITLAIIIIYVSGSDRRTRKIRQISETKCEPLEWKCDNGECIDINELCNGKINCRDQSDETINSCISFRCPPYAFRCSYGACISGLAECNGIKECADNSDELTLKCPGVLTPQNLQGTCSDNQYNCDVNVCITTQKLCDGIYDCNDRSDESIERCSSSNCPAYAFRCGYGACISTKRVCNGNFDCVDGSDELSCNITAIVNTNTKTDENSCLVSQLLNGNIYASGRLEQIPIGNYVDNFASVMYKYNDKFYLKGEQQNLCIDGKWASKLPICKRYCSSAPLMSPTIRAFCEYQGNSINCEQKMLETGTKAIVACALSYEKDLNFYPNTFQCTPSGEWYPEIFRCNQTCGITPNGVPLISGGEKLNNTKVPWHVAIYSTYLTKINYICGGSIINARIVISAAHCFWDVSNNIFYDPKYFKIGAGKYYQAYDATEPLLTTFHNVTEIVTPPGYKYELGLHIADIALLILEDFIEFKSHVIPICIQYEIDRNVNIDVGYVPGWGVSDSDRKSSDVLKGIELPIISREQCEKDSPPNFIQYIGPDKLCAGYLTGIGVCQGDSGGGLILKQRNKYLLYGVVSVGVRKDDTCDLFKYTTFTSIQFYINFIHETEMKYRIH